MESFERVSIEILSYIKDKKTRMLNLIMSTPGETRFILCGSSGSGKTRAVEETNKKLPDDQGIRTCFLLKKVSKNPKVQNITPPLIQAQHVVLVSGEV